MTEKENPPSTAPLTPAPEPAKSSPLKEEPKKVEAVFWEKHPMETEFKKNGAGTKADMLKKRDQFRGEEDKKHWTFKVCAPDVVAADVADASEIDS